MSDSEGLKANLRSAYDADAERRDTLEVEPWRLDVMDQWAGELRARDHKSVLELGCGTGQLALHMSDNLFEVTAIDLSPGNVAAVVARGIDASVADFAELPFPDESFDAAFGFNSLLHVPPVDLKDVLIEIRRVLRPGGSLLIVVWGGINSTGPMPDDWFDPPRYFALYTDEQFASITGPGLKKVRFDTLDISRGALHPQVLVLEAA
jgi:SAM-dependent methyltransferase